MMGLNNSTSTYSCLWCTVSKDKRYFTSKTIRTYTVYKYTLYRWGMSVDEAVYNSPPPTGKARTLASMLHKSKFTVPKKHLGSKNPPILQVEPTQVILDELHLLLRIGDVLLRNIILQADSIDQRENMHRGGHTENHLQTLELFVNSCNVPFIIKPVHNKRNTNVYIRI